MERGTNRRMERGTNKITDKKSTQKQKDIPQGTRADGLIKLIYNVELT